MVRRHIAVGLIVWGVAGASAACTDGASDAPASTDAAGAAGSDRSVGRATAALVRGTVREQIPVPPYVYLRLDTNEGEVWAAVAEAPVSVGAEVTVFNAMLMEQFVSTSLARTFDRIWFGALEPPANGVHGALGAGAMTQESSTAGAAAADLQIGPITPASGADARTIGALWAERAQLAGTGVSVRGVVVKVNEAVMGKNWLHLRDGTGDATRGTHDLTVTSAELAAVGDTVTVTGIVRLDRDVGAGYTYALLVENARVVRR